MPESGFRYGSWPRVGADCRLTRARRVVPTCRLPPGRQCEKSGARDNLWLNLSDGFIGGGRQNWDGSGGSNGAVEHFAETGALYPLVVKLGTVTADVGTADCYSYAPDEDGPVTVPNLAELLARRGIRAAGM